MEIVFVLVEPKVPENVGAAARAMNTMGFRRLRLVNSDLHQTPEARWMAHQSTELLETAEVFPDLASALADVDLSMGTSARLRSVKRTFYGPRELVPLLNAKQGRVSRVAIVFGREDRGLSSEEMALCTLLTSAPLAQPQPSLNLAQAVMVYAWELSPLHERTNSVADAVPAETDFKALERRITTLLATLDKVPGSKLEQWILESLVRLGSKDIHFLHTLCQSLERRLGL